MRLEQVLFMVIPVVGLVGLGYVTMSQVRRAWKDRSARQVVIAAVLLILLIWALGSFSAGLFWVGTIGVIYTVLLLQFTVIIHRRLGGILAALMLLLFGSVWLRNPPSTTHLLLLVGAPILGGLIAFGLQRRSPRLHLLAWLLGLVWVGAAVATLAVEELYYHTFGTYLPAMVLGFAAYEGLIRSPGNAP